MRLWICGAAASLSLAGGAAQAAALFTASADAAGGPVKAFTTPGLHVTHNFTPFGAGIDGASVGAARNDDGRATLVVGAGAGGQRVTVFDPSTGLATHDFNPFDAGYTGGVRVAAGDVNGDGVADIVVGAGAGVDGHVKVFDGSSGLELRSFDAFTGFAGGITVAAGDVNGDGRADLIVGAGAGGGPHVKVFDGATGAGLFSFFAFDPTFAGGVNVGFGRNAGGGTILVGAGAGGHGHVKVFDGVSGGEIDSFFAFGDDYDGGVSVAGGSFGRLDSLFVGGDGGLVNVFAADRRGGAQASFRAFPDGGVNVAGLFAVPEPQAWALMILGFAGVGGALRRRQSRAA